MSQVEKISNPVIPQTKIKYGLPRKVDGFTTQSETFWPGHLGAEVTITSQKYPLLKKLYVPGEGIYMVWHNGSEAFIPLANIKCMIFESE